ncbi:hypothetical protein [Chromatium okenii]|nr:hypothetical protein [Chromatium okenii]
MQAALPWLATESQIGLHTIHVAGSQNGWQRPAHGAKPSCCCRAAPS